MPEQNNSKRAYQLVKDLISEKQGRSSTIQDRPGKCLTEEQEILADRQNIAQNCTTMRAVVKTQYLTADLQPILREEVEIAETMTNVLTEI